MIVKIKERKMKNCKWIVYLILFLLYTFIVFRYIQKRSRAHEEQVIDTSGEEITLPLNEEEIKDK